MTTVADVILEQLAAWGVKRIYGVAGEAITPILDALNRQDHIKYVAVRHEFAAGIMASTEGKCSKHLAACLGTSGPGLVNMLNGLADASLDRIPLLVITGQMESRKLGLEAKQYVNQQQMIAPLAVYSELLTHPEAITDLLANACIAALSKRGVAHISIPKDLLSLPCHQPIRAPLGMIQRERREALHDLDQAAIHLASAKKPMILIGEGARESREEIETLAELIQAGIVESLGAKGTIPFTNPYHLGGLGAGGSAGGERLLKQADCVLLVGVNWWPEGFVPNEAKLIKIDLSSSHIEEQTGLTCGLVGKAFEILRLLIQRVRDFQEIHPPAREAWQALLNQTKRMMEAELEQERALDGSPLAPPRIMAALEQVVEEDAILVVDTGDHTLWFNRSFRAVNQKILYSGKWRTMGYALPAALAAKLVHPDRQVIAIIGDGGFAMSMMELVTAVTYDLAITILVLNNHSLAMEKHHMMLEGFQPFGVDLVNPNFAQLAQSCGITGLEVRQAEELLPKLQQAMAVDKPVLVDIHTSCLMPPLLEKKVKK